MKYVNQDNEILKKIYQELIELRDDINDLKCRLILEEEPTENEVENILSGLQDIGQGKKNHSNEEIKTQGDEKVKELLDKVRRERKKQQIPSFNSPEEKIAFLKKRIKEIGPISSKSAIED